MLFTNNCLICRTIFQTIFYSFRGGKFFFRTLDIATNIFAEAAQNCKSSLPNDEQKRRKKCWITSAGDDFLKPCVTSTTLKWQKVFRNKKKLMNTVVVRTWKKYSKRTDKRIIQLLLMTYIYFNLSFLKYIVSTNFFLLQEMNRQLIVKTHVVITDKGNDSLGI